MNINNINSTHTREVDRWWTTALASHSPQGQMGAAAPNLIFGANSMRKVELWRHTESWLSATMLVVTSTLFLDDLDIYGSNNKNLAIANRSCVSCINTNNNIMTLKSDLEVTQCH